MISNMVFGDSSQLPLLPAIAALDGDLTFEEQHVE